MNKAEVFDRTLAEYEDAKDELYEVHFQLGKVREEKDELVRKLCVWACDIVDRYPEQFASMYWVKHKEKEQCLTLPRT